MLKKIKYALIGLAVIIALLIAKSFYDQYRIWKYDRRVMELLRHPERPNVVIDPDGTIRGDGYVIRP